MYIYTDNLEHNLIQHIKSQGHIIRNMESDLNDVPNSVIILFYPEPKFIAQIDSAWRGKDLLIVIIDDHQVYWFNSGGDSLKRSLMIRSIHRTHAEGIVGPWFLHLQISTNVEEKSIWNTIEHCLNLRYQCRICSMILGDYNGT